MSFGLAAFTLFHTALSIVAMASGFVVVADLLRSRESPAWTRLFLVTAFLTSATGFGFPFDKVLPSHIVAAIALAVLVVTVAARSVFGLVGAWRGIYAFGLALSLYLDVFVLVAQLFAKTPTLAQWVAGSSVNPFAVVQGLLLIGFIVMSVFAVRRFVRASPA